MNVSASEFTSRVTRAALGAGWSQGLAVDFARAGLWMAQRRHALGLLLEALDDPAQEVAAVKPAAIVRFEGAPVIAIGPSVFELLALDGVDVVEIANVKAAGLLLGYAGASMAEHGFVAETRDGTVPLDPSVFDQSTVRLSCGSHAAAGLPDPNPISIDAEIWSALGRFAEESFVASTEASRAAGAGAGLTDND